MQISDLIWKFNDSRHTKSKDNKKMQIIIMIQQKRKSETTIIQTCKVSARRRASAQWGRLAEDCLL